MKITGLASSSKGNAYLVEDDGVALLIDDGVPLKLLKNRRIDAVLITHNHVDHISGLECFHRKFPEVAIYSNCMTAEAIVAQCKIEDDAFVCFENGQEFDVGPFSISAFAIPHDTPDPVGYVIKSGEMTYFHGTDIGTPLDSIGAKLHEADVATLESNHDSEMLRQSMRPISVKQRILGPRGHLSNDDACYLVRRFASSKLKKLYLAHLSSDCNLPRIARNMMVDTLAQIGRTDIDLEIL